MLFTATSNEYLLFSGSGLANPTINTVGAGSTTVATIAITENLMPITHPVSLWAEPISLNLIAGTTVDLTFTWPCVATSVSSYSFTIEQNGDEPIPTGVLLDDTIPELKIDPVPSVTTTTVMTFKLRMTWDTTWVTEKPFYITIDACSVENCQV